MPPNPRRRRAPACAADLDNNGAIDLVLSPLGSARACGAQTRCDLARQRRGQLRARSSVRRACDVFDVADLNGDGQLDLVGVSADGQAAAAAQSGTKDYHWQVDPPARARRPFGDQRINSFGVGGEIEVRVGLAGAEAGDRRAARPLRPGRADGRPTSCAIVWPNGIVQAEFDVEGRSGRSSPSSDSRARVRSCSPSTGSDALRDRRRAWRSPLGLRINAQDTAGVAATEDWFKIRGDQLVPHDGDYDLRITAELWETHYFDHVCADGRRSSRRHRGLRRRAIRRSAGQAGDHHGRRRRTPIARARDDQRPRRDRARRDARRPLPRHFRPRPLPGRDARSLGRGRARRRRSARPAALAGRQRLDPSDRQLDQRRHRPGQAWRAARPGPGSAGRSRRLDGRAARPRLPGGQEQDDPRRPDRRIPPGHARDACGCGPTSNLLGLGSRWAEELPETSAQDTSRSTPLGRPSLPRLFGRERQADASSRSCPTTTDHRGTQASAGAT